MRSTGRAPRTAARPVTALAVVTAVVFVTFLDTTIVSVALGAIRNELRTDVSTLQWVVNAYTVVFAGLMLAGGSLGDRWGRKRVMIAGLVVFCAGSAVAALAATVPLLILGRAIMGVGAAASEPGTLSLLRQIFPDERARARALGVWAAAAGLALAAGPVLGGVLVHAYGWRSIFWFNLVLGAAALLAALWSVPESSDPPDGPVDWAGFVLGAGFLGAVIYAAIAGEHEGYTSGPVLALFVGGALALVAFVVVELRARAPMLQLRYLRPPAVRSALVVAFAVYFGIFSIFFFTALYLQVMHSYSGARTAAVFTPMAVAIVVASLAAGFWVARRGARTPMIAGCLVGAAGILLTRYTLEGAIEDAPLAAAMALAGAGFGVAVVPLTSAVLSGLPAEHSGMAAAATNTMRQVGSAVGVAVLGALVNSLLTADLKARMSELGLPPELQPFVVDAVQRGGIPPGTNITPYLPYYSKLNEVLNTGREAFHHGLEVALLVSAVLILVAAVVTAFDAPERAGGDR
ncbi:MFS transporter [Nocardia harenae]|uniref:MFS transporter n=1 Tax=Nocardia harenae TaxID=358707 RepID=UPI0014725E94|nr:MFS transporter [Nocardia harenae]